MNNDTKRLVQDKEEMLLHRSFVMFVHVLLLGWFIDKVY